MTLFEERFLSVVCAKFGTKMVAGRRSPKLNATIVRTERLAAEHAVDGAAVHEIPAAREHLESLHRVKQHNTVPLTESATMAQ